jgi:hypothetical protein
MHASKVSGSKSMIVPPSKKSGNKSIDHQMFNIFSPIVYPNIGLLKINDHIEISIM